MAKTPQRIIALVAALLFLASTIGFSVFVIMQMREESTRSGDVSEIDDQNNQQEGKLEGTKLDNFTPVSEVNELQVIDIKEGDGEVVPEGATVTAHYTGALTKTGVIFQSSKDFGSPIPFSLTQVIAGWAQGVPGMKVGGQRRLIIPAAMAYGEQGSPPSIGPNEPLVFDIEIVKLGE